MTDRMSAGMQCFILDLEKRIKLAQIFLEMQKILFCILRRKYFVKNVLSPLDAMTMSRK
jgi:hypothetical protein